MALQLQESLRVAGMLTLRAILVPVDFSERSQRVAGQAAAIAECCHSRLVLLHVLPAHLLAFELAEAGTWIATRALENEAREQIIRLSRAASPPAEALMRWGDPAGCIAAVAAETSADLIVMASRKRGWRERFLAVSLTRTVLQQVACPVLFATERENDGAPPVPYRHIACAVDSTKDDEAAFRWAAGFAQLCGAELTVIRCGAPSAGGFAAAPAFRAVFDTRASDARGAASELSAELHPDLLVVGRRLTNGLSRRVPKTASDLAEECRCPVVSVCAARDQKPAPGSLGWKAA